MKCKLGASTWIYGLCKVYLESCVCCSGRTSPTIPVIVRWAKWALWYHLIYIMNRFQNETNIKYSFTMIQGVVWDEYINVTFPKCFVKYCSIDSLICLWKPYLGLLSSTRKLLTSAEFLAPNRDLLHCLKTFDINLRLSNYDDIMIIFYLNTKT